VDQRVSRDSPGTHGWVSQRWDRVSDAMELSDAPETGTKKVLNSVASQEPGA
jgi:hypothetical protein